MIRLLLTSLFGVVAALTAGSARVSACTCVVNTSPCHAEWTADAIFVGEVTANVRWPEPDAFLSRRVTFVVREAFAGVDARLVDVRTGSGGGDCGFAFTVGSTYLVYAYRHSTTGALSTGICSRTTLAAHAPELTFLRTPPRPLAEPAVVHGRAMRTELQSVNTPRINEPFAGARLRLAGEQGSRETDTAADGRYEFRVPAGRYRLTVEVPEGFYSRPDAITGRDVRVVDKTPCAPIDVEVRSDGRVRGRLMDADGRAVPFLSVDLANRSIATSPYLFPAARTMTDAEGRFEFTRLAPGVYDIGLTLRRFPQRGSPDHSIVLRPPAPLDIGFGTIVDTGAIQLARDVEVRQVTGLVVNEAGAPVSNVEVRTETVGADLGVVGGPVMTDALGRFQMTVIGGRIHELIAEDRIQVGERSTYRTARSAAFDAASAQAPFALVLKEP